ncbi:DUF4270 domain-containing protein [Hymenobacter aerilatus]|uniref:DUF4270 domain-containing protein n=1 Tax=Hymenobacter aerilatus TaxID=2932251 RepID=A0A8T9SRS4_9BACT|nr:DUF4270 family protein [Hymenobacter aerilatus]UOR04812.1 DUF4270 domain-containing protein [Hymenobacter aerilatus]
MNWPTKALRRWSACLLSAPVLLLTTGCEDPNSITVELPGSATTTTEYRDLPVTAYTVRRDSLPTLNASQILVGRVRDNNTGIVTTTRAYTNLQVTSDPLPATFAGAQLDSVTLIMAYTRAYGTTAQPGRFSVLHLQQKLDERVAYNSSTSAAVGIPLLRDVAVSYGPERRERQPASPSSTTDTVTTVATIPQALNFRIAKSASFSTGLFALLQKTDFSQAKLDAYIAGLAIIPTDEYVGAVASVNPSYTILAVYYHDPARPSMRRVYRIASNVNNDARYFTQITSDFSAAGPLAVVANKQQSVPAAATNGVTYIQDGVGLATKLVIPGLEDLRKQSGVTINRAELLVPVKPFSNSVFPYPGYQSLNDATKSASINKTYLYEANNENNRVLQRTILANPVNRLVQADGYNAQSQSLDRTGAGSQAEGTLYSVDASTFYYSMLMTSYTQAYLLNQLGGELPSAFLFSPTLSLSKAYQPTVNLSLNRAVLDANNIKLRVYFSNRQ